MEEMVKRERERVKEMELSVSRSETEHEAMIRIPQRGRGRPSTTRKETRSILSGIRRFRRSSYGVGGWQRVSEKVNNK